MRPGDNHVPAPPVDVTAGSGRGLRVLAADEDEAALRRVAAMLHELGHEVVEIAVDAREAAAAVAREEPDASLVVVHQDDEHALELIEEIGAFSSGPVIALLHGEDADFVRRAAERGVDAYARHPTPESVQGAIEVAMRRHTEKRELTTEVERLKTALDRRALIERAKGILMERHGIDERAAFDLLRGHARGRNRTVVDVSASVAEGHALLPRGDEPMA